MFPYSARHVERTSQGGGGKNRERTRLYYEGRAWKMAEYELCVFFIYLNSTIYYAVYVHSPNELCVIR